MLTMTPPPGGAHAGSRHFRAADGDTYGAEASTQDAREAIYPGVSFCQSAVPVARSDNYCASSADIAEGCFEAFLMIRGCRTR